MTAEDLAQASTEHARDQFDVAVVGGGQAGLAIGYWLAKQGRRFVILEAGDSVATAWRKRWDSLVLFTSRRYDALPGVAFPGDPDGYPTRDEVIAYLERYESEFNLPVQTNSRVRSLTVQDGRFLLDLGERRIQAKQVVVATGPFQAARTPAWAGSLAPDVFQIHSSDYRRPSEIPAGTVLVVGGGNTGYQIAKELTVTHEVHLAVGSRQTPLPQRLLGRDLFWWLDKLGLLEKSVDSRIGRRARDRGDDTLIGSNPRQARRRGVQLRPRAVKAEGGTITFEDGSTLNPASGDLGDRLPDRSLLDRASRRRRRWHSPASAGRHRRAGPVLPGPTLAVHTRVGAAWLGQGRRPVHRRADRCQRGIN